MNKKRKNKQCKMQEKATLNKPKFKTRKELNQNKESGKRKHRKQRAKTTEQRNLYILNKIRL